MDQKYLTSFRRSKIGFLKNGFHGREQHTEENRIFDFLKKWIKIQISRQNYFLDF